MIGIITPNYKRPKVLELWCASIQRIRKEIGFYIPAVVVSDAEDKQICDKYFVNHVTMSNISVSAKFNRGMEFMKDYNVEHVVISGSDDIFSTDTIRRIIEKADKGYDLIGLDSIYFYALDGAHKGQLCCHKHHKMLGVGKTLSRGVLEKVNWKPWQKDKNWGLDALVTQSTLPFVKTQTILSDTIVVDCKNTKININKPGIWFRKKPAIDSNIFLNILGEEEKQILKTL